METIIIDGASYEKGSPEHLAKIGEMHKAEILEQSRAHVRDIIERTDLANQTRLVHEDLEKTVRQRVAAQADARLADAKEEIQESEARFRLLVDGVKDYALYLLDPDGNVQSWNAGAEHIKGYTAAEIMGKHLSSFYEEADVASGRPQKNLADAVANGRSEDEGWRRRKDGSRFWANVVLAPIRDTSGTLLGFAKIARDLTERRHLEEQLHQSQKLEALGSLAGGVAHDFNNLLSVVLSYSEILAADLKENDPMRSDLHQIRDAGLRAVALTRQLLAFSRQQVLQPQIMDLSTVIEGMTQMLQRLIGEDVDLAVLCPAGLGKVLIDPGQVEQVIMNLAVNSRDAMPEGGKLTIEMTEIVLDHEHATKHVGGRPGPHLMLAVTDTGAGMDKATLARIFEPFFTTKEMGKGTGLGLATVFGIVKQSGGSIWVYSEPGQGTVFKIYFPMADRDAIITSALPRQENRGAGGSETILLVEDDDRVRVLVRSILRRLGYNVLDAQSGGDAFLLCEQHAGVIDLLLTDVVMPRMSGRQLAERLRPIRPGMKVLYMSGYTDDAVVRHGILHSTISFIQKPITPEPLARKVREVLDMAPWEAPSGAAPPPAS